jgi:hypothetical protein
MSEDFDIEDRVRRTLNAVAGQPIPSAPPVFEPSTERIRPPVRTVGVVLGVVAVVAAVTLALIFGPGNSPSNTPSQKPVPASGSHASTTTTTAPPLGAAKASVVAGLPVPSSAVVVVDKPNELGEYRLPNGVSLASLNEWFDQHLPQNVWKQWVRCRLTNAHGPGAGKIWSWEKDGSLLDIVTISIPGQVRFTEKLQKQSLLSCT